MVFSRWAALMTEPISLVFRASLEPGVYRDVEIADTSSLYDLAEAIVGSFNFDFDHPFGFYDKLTGNIHASRVRYEVFADIGESEPGSIGVERTRATEAFPSDGAKMRFLFDYGDEWLFLVELIRRAPTEPGVNLPRVLAATGEAPEQYPAFDDDPEA